MNVVHIFEAITVLTGLVFFVPLRFKQRLCLLLSLTLSAVTGCPDFLIQLIQQAIQVLPGGHVLTINN